MLNTFARPANAALARVAGVTFVLFAASLPLGLAPMTVAGGLCVVAALAAGIPAGRMPWARSPLDLAALGWLAACVLATLFAADRAASARSLDRGALILVVGLAAWLASDRVWGRRAIAALLAAGSVVALIGVARFLAEGGRFPARAIGLGGSWMTFGVTMMLLASLGFAIAGTARARAWRMGAALAAFAAAAGLVTSFTRAAWLGMAVSLIVIVSLTRARWLAALPLALAVLFVLPGDFGDRLRSAVDPAHAVNRERMLMWDAGVRILRDHPVTGVGLVDLAPHLERYRSPEAVEPTRHLHDSYLQVAVTTGAIGFVAFALLCVALLRTASRGLRGAVRAGGFGGGVRLGVTAGAAGFLVAALFDHAFGDRTLVAMLFTLAGIAWAARGWDAPAA